MLAEEIHCAAGHPEKEGAPSRCLQMLLLGLGELNGVNSVGNSHTQAKQYLWAALKIKKLGMGRLGHNYKCCFIVLDMHMFVWVLLRSFVRNTLFRIVLCGFPNFCTVCKCIDYSKALQQGLLKCSKCATLLIRWFLSSSAK